MTEQIKALLADPDRVAWMGEMLRGFSVSEIEELGRIFEGVNGDRLREWAHHERQNPHSTGVTQPPRKSLFGFVYLMRNNRTGNIKIGFSKHPSMRERTLQAEEPDIVLIKAEPRDRSREAELHEHFASKRLRGEWFALSAEELEEAINRL